MHEPKPRGSRSIIEPIHAASAKVNDVLSSVTRFEGDSVGTKRGTGLCSEENSPHHRCRNRTRSMKWQC